MILWERPGEIVTILWNWKFHLIKSTNWYRLSPKVVLSQIEKLWLNVNQILNYKRFNWLYNDLVAKLSHRETLIKMWIVALILKFIFKSKNLDDVHGITILSTDQIIKTYRSVILFTDQILKNYYIKIWGKRAILHFIL